VSVLDRRDDSHGRLTNCILADCAGAPRDRIVARAECKLFADWLHLHWPTAGGGTCEPGLVDMMFLCPLKPDALIDGPTPLPSPIELLLSRRPRRRPAGNCWWSCFLLEEIECQ